jgi:hypothetical protein
MGTTYLFRGFWVLPWECMGVPDRVEGILFRSGESVQYMGVCFNEKQIRNIIYKHTFRDKCDFE